MDDSGLEYRLGIEIMDREHEQLVNLVRELQMSINEHGSVRRPLAPAVARLLVGAPAHFDSEEKLMADSGYPGLAAHRAIHQGLVSQLRIFAAELLTDEVTAARKIHSVLSAWLFEHIQTEDSSFARFALGVEASGGAQAFSHAGNAFRGDQGSPHA